MSTTLAKPGQIERKWYILDAAGKPLGRVAAKAAVLLRGKDKVTFTQRSTVGDHVIIINCDKAVLTGSKLGQEVLPHPLWLDRRPEGDQVPHPDGGEVRQGDDDRGQGDAAPQYSGRRCAQAAAGLQGR